jgi:hypothetical protein
MKRKGFGRKQPWLNMRYYPSINLQGFRKPQKLVVILSVPGEIQTNKNVIWSEHRIYAVQHDAAI